MAPPVSAQSAAPAPHSRRTAPAKPRRKAPAASAAPVTYASAASAASSPPDRVDLIAEGLSQKASAKQAIYRATQAAFGTLRTVAQELCLELTRKVTASTDASVRIEYQSVNELEFHIRFSGDLLVFVMHSNIITFPADAPLLHLAYVEADFRRRFFGQIMAYNFMADSIRYQRLNDPGYLLGRLLVNIEQHYYLEGVQQLDLGEQDMACCPITPEAMRLFVESAMIAAINNDLLAPSLNDIQRISVKQKLENQQVSRGSKVGFSFSHQQVVE